MSMYPMAENAKTASIDMGRRQTLREGLLETKRVLESRLANINEAISFLDTNPEFEQFHNIVGKAGF